MSARKDTPMSTRIPQAMVDELDALAKRIKLDSDALALIGPMRGVSRAAVLRLALVEGLKVLNAKHPKPRRRKAPGRKKP